MNNLLFFMFALFTTMSIMNFYFHITLARSGIVHFGRIFDAENIDGKFVLRILLKDQRKVPITVGDAISDKKFEQFYKKHINNVYEVLEIKNGDEVRFIHNGSYKNKAILFLIGSIGMAATLFYNMSLT